MVKNRRGWLRIVEAMTALLIILGILLTLSINKEARKSDDLGPLITPILEEIAQNAQFRTQILSDASAEASIKQFVGTKITGALGYDVKICEPNDICSLNSYPANIDGNVYAKERMISASPEMTIYAPKKVKIFLWRKA